VLKPTGSLWVAIGDCYGGSGKGRRSDGTHGDKSSKKQYTNTGTIVGKLHKTPGRDRCLLGVPWRLAFSLIDDGWTLRNDIVWHKPNAFPSSQKSRFTNCYEHVLFFTKVSSGYYFNMQAIVEPAQEAKKKRGERVRNHGGRTDGYTIVNGSFGSSQTRQPRDVWSIPTQSIKGKNHFATYPESLAEKCLLAGCPQGGIVVDCFAGFGTTAVVAERLGINSINIDIKQEYLNAAQERLNGKGS
jgi:DNA modification methylase